MSGVVTVAATLLVASVLASAESARAEPMPARDTASVLPARAWRAGIFAPLEIGVGHGAEVSASLVPWFLLSPNLGVRLELGHFGPVTVSGEYGLSVPTGAMRLLQGYLFPSFSHGQGEVGWSLVPGAGVVVSSGRRGVLTGRLDTAFGIPLGPTDAHQLDTYAPIELLFAPTLTGYRAHLGVTYDYAIFDWLRGRAGVSGYLVGRGSFPYRSPLTFSAEAALEVAIGSRVRVSAGAVYYNYDQRATALEKDAEGHVHRVSVRSNDFFPTVDLIVGSKP